MHDGRCSSKCNFLFKKLWYSHPVWPRNTPVSGSSLPTGTDQLEMERYRLSYQTFKISVKHQPTYNWAYSDLHLHLKTSPWSQSSSLEPILPHRAAVKTKQAQNHPCQPNFLCAQIGYIHQISQRFRQNVLSMQEMQIAKLIKVSSPPTNHCSAFGLAKLAYFQKLGIRNIAISTIVFAMNGHKSGESFQVTLEGSKSTSWLWKCK